MSEIQRFAKAQRDAFDAIRAGNPALDTARVKVSQLTDVKNSATKAAQQWTGALSVLPGQLGAVTNQAASLALALRGPAGLVVGIAAVVAAGAGFAKSMSNNIERLDNLNRVTGLSVAALESFEHIAKQAGAAPEELARGLGAINTAISDVIKGGDSASKTFQTIGVDLRTLVKDGATTEQVLEATAKAIAGIEDPTRRAAAMADIFGTRSKALQIALDRVAKDGIGPLVAEMERLGVVTSKEALETARRVDEMADRFDAAIDRMIKKSKEFAAEGVLGVAKDLEHIASAIVANYTAVIAVIMEARAAMGLASQEAAAQARRTADAAQALAAMTSSLMTPEQAALRGERPPPQDAGGAKPRVVAADAAEIAAIKAVEDARMKLFKESHEALLQEDERVRDILGERVREDYADRVANAEALKKLAADTEFAEMNAALKTGTQNLEDYKINLELTRDVTLQNNDAVDASVASYQASGEASEFAGNAARQFRLELEGLPLTISAVGDENDRTWRQTQEQIDEGVAALFRMRDALGPPLLTPLEQFGAGFQKVSDQFTAGLLSWEAQGAATAHTLFTALDDGFFELLSGEVKNLEDVFDNLWKAVLHQISAFLAAAAVRELMDLFTALGSAGSTDSAASSASSSGGGETSTWISTGVKILGTFFSEEQAAGATRVALEQQRTGEVGRQLDLEKAKTAAVQAAAAAASVGGPDGMGGGFQSPTGSGAGLSPGNFNPGDALKGGLKGAALGAMFGPAGMALGALAGALIAGFGLFADAVDAVKSALNIGTPKLMELGMTAEQLAAAAVTASQSGTAAMHALDRNTEVIDQTTEAANKNTAGYLSLSDSLDVMSASIADATIAAGNAAEVAGAAAEQANAAADRAEGAAADAARSGEGGGGGGTAGGGSTGDSGTAGGGPGGPSGPFLHGGWVKGYAPGGWVTNGEWGRDSVMAKLARGEFVLNARAASFAPGVIESYNRNPSGTLDRLMGGNRNSADVETTDTGEHVTHALLQEQNKHLKKLVDIVDRGSRGPGRGVGASV